MTSCGVRRPKAARCASAARGPASNKPHTTRESAGFAGPPRSVPLSRQAQSLGAIGTLLPRPRRRNLAACEGGREAEGGGKEE